MGYRQLWHRWMHDTDRRLLGEVSVDVCPTRWLIGVEVQRTSVDWIVSAMVGPLQLTAWWRR